MTGFFTFMYINIAANKFIPVDGEITLVNNSFTLIKNPIPIHDPFTPVN